MAQTKQVRVSELVHQELSKLKTDDETFDDVLRRVLELQPDINSLLQYYTDEQQEVANKLISEINSTGDLNQSVKTSGNIEILEFQSKHSERVVATLEFEEKPSSSKITVKYRNQKGDLETIGDVRKKRDEPLKGGIHGEHGLYDNPEELVAVARRRAADAYNAWG